MALIVQKFGGSSVGDAAKIKHVARRVIETQKAGNQVVVVVSAMGDTTDELIDLAQSVAHDPYSGWADLRNAGIAVLVAGHDAGLRTGERT